MAGTKIIGILTKYIPFIGILVLHIFSLYRGATTVTDEINRNIQIWTDTLIISAIIGSICSLLVLDLLNILITGKTLNIVQDVLEKTSQDAAVMYNGMVVSSLFLPVVFIINMIYITTGNRLFLSITAILVTLWSIGIIINISAAYLEMNHKYSHPVISKLTDSVILSVIICMIQILITRTNWVGYIYNSIYKPENEFFLTLGLIIVLCYFLAIAFCHFSNVYCLVSLGFIRRDLGKIQKKIDYIQKRKENQEALLRQTTQDIDEKGAQGNFIKIIGLIVPFYIIHIKTYVLERFCAVSYLLSLLNLRITKLFSGLLEPDRIRINRIRFCLVTAVVELLSLDFILFIYFENHAPCLKFFELLSTVIIIPILLSWLGELKSKANGKNRSGMEIE
ncbi:hypothetical protein [Pseudoflavonifractor capillosus]|uniref:hypothetical protein n=1 Tax=Pseudoflavonifractor capillosus TaxID=106588 RepID=UPI00195AA9C7|nr:hypothetical protein [Pseudoflavonifractor capillosus]MBM6679394.1 hypothetical protein [Pseudoflavonifractor capillosus]